MAEPVEIHTSDSILFKRCRRRWGFLANARQNLKVKTSETSTAMWLGTGGHFALEDYHGYHRFPSMEAALVAYYNAFSSNELPPGAEDALGILVGVLEYYPLWLERRNDFQTLWIDGKPQVEVQFQLLLDELSEYAGRPVIYQGTLDRVVQDSHGRLYVQDYKFVSTIDTMKLALDPQITRYLWAAEQWYQREFEGMVYTQFAKVVPEEPRRVRGGFSKDRRQRTTHRIYRDALIREFGKVPLDYVEFLNFLAEQESYEGDRFIRQDIVYRPIEAKKSAYQHILDEGREMLNPDLPLYPNPTKDCIWDCPIRTICIAMEEGADWEYLVDELLVSHEKGEMAPWRRKVRYPQTLEYDQ